MEGHADEFQDWEVLHDSDESTLVNSPDDSVDSMSDFEGVESDSVAIIRSDHFSLGSPGKHARAVPEPDSPSPIHPGSELGHLVKEHDEVCSDSGGDGSIDRQFGDFGVKNELGFPENAKNELGFEGIGEIGAESEKSGQFLSASSGIGASETKCDDTGEDNGVGADNCDNSGERSEILTQEKGEEGSEELAVEAMKAGGGGGEGVKRSVVWWKLPMEMLKYCGLRVSPVWSFSVAAAVMGLAILGRRLYKMKRKSRTLQLKITVDDKRVSQVTSHAARLNEAFSVVKRVPIIRHSLPAAGVAPWPVVSLR